MQIEQSTLCTADCAEQAMQIEHSTLCTADCAEQAISTGSKK